MVPVCRSRHGHEKHVLVIAPRCSTAYMNPQNGQETNRKTIFQFPIFWGDPWILAEFPTRSSIFPIKLQFWGFKPIRTSWGQAPRAAVPGRQIDASPRGRLPSPTVPTVPTVRAAKRAALHVFRGKPRGFGAGETVGQGIAHAVCHDQGMYIICIYYILCIYYVYIMYILCIHYVFIIYILSIYYVYIIYIYIYAHYMLDIIYIASFTFP